VEHHIELLVSEQAFERVAVAHIESVDNRWLGNGVGVSGR